MQRFLAASCVAIAASIAAGGIVNGSFESGVNPESEGLGYVDPGPFGIDGWTIVGDVDYTGSYWQAAEGTRSVDLNGEAAATLEQWVQTVPNQTYTLSFAMAANFIHQPYTKTMTVFAGPTQANFQFVTPANVSTLNMGWTHYNLEFVADSVLTRIAFQSTTPGNGGPALDDVSLVPAPSSAVILGVGLIGLSRRRRHWL